MATPVPEIDVYKLISDPESVISEGARSYYDDWISKWGNTPVEEIPQEEAAKMAGFFFNAYKNTPIDDIPENVKPIVMQTLIQVTAEDTKGTYKQWAESVPKLTNKSEAAVYSLLNAIPFYEPTQETVSQMAYMAGSSLRGNLLDKNTLEEEFNYRVRRAQSGAGLITAPELAGAFFDTAGIVGGSFTAGLAASGKLGPIAAGLLGNTLEGGGYGALMPVYPEFGDSRLLNSAGGAAIGFGLTSALLSPVIAGQAAREVGRKVAVVSPEQQRLMPRTGEIDQAQPVPFFETRVPAEVDEILTAQSKAPSGVEVTVPEMPMGPTPVTYNVKPFVHRVSKAISPAEAKKVVTESNVDIRVLDQQIKQLEDKAALLQGKTQKRTQQKRSAIDKKIKALKEERRQKLSLVDDRVNNNNYQISRLNKIIQEAESNPSVKGAVPRAIRAKRRALQLEKENVLHLTGGHAYVDWADPVQTAAFRNFALESGKRFVTPPPPQPTGNKVEDAIAQVNYAVSTGTKREPSSSVTIPLERDTIGFEPRKSLSSAGVRPSIQYKEELRARGYGEDSIPGFGVSAYKARQTYKEDPSEFKGVAPELRTQEEMGRLILNEEATAGQRAIIQGELAGFSPEQVATDMENFAYRIEGGWDNLNKLAAKIREEEIEQGYNSMVDFVLDPDNKTRLMSGEYTQALQDLWIMAENRRTQYGTRLYDLQQQNLVNSEAYVQALDEYLLATKITDLYKSIGSARGRALNQLKLVKKHMEENARKTAKGIIIDNLFGVKCG